MIVEWMSRDGEHWEKFCELLYLGSFTQWAFEYWKTKLPYVRGGYKYWRVELR